MPAILLAPMLTKGIHCGRQRTAHAPILHSRFLSKSSLQIVYFYAVPSLASHHELPPPSSVGHFVFRILDMLTLVVPQVRPLYFGILYTLYCIDPCINVYMHVYPFFLYLYNISMFSESEEEGSILETRYILLGIQ